MELVSHAEKRAFRNQAEAVTKENMKNSTRNNKATGFTLVEIMIVVGIIGILAAIAIPNFVKARETSQRNACIANLKQIDGAKQTWALETRQLASGLPETNDIAGVDKYIRGMPVCPSGGNYTLNAVDSKPMCSRSASPEFHALTP